MFYLTTEALVRMALVAVIINLALLWMVLWRGIFALWRADRVLTNMIIEYNVQRHMREWSAKQYTAENTSEEEASLTN